MSGLEILPSVNACLNAGSALCLALGFVLIKNHARSAHAVCMLAALTLSTAFLVSYLVYHFHHGTTRFSGDGWLRVFYLTLLTSHTILAVILLPLVIRTFLPAWRGDFERHKRRARWTFPVWAYVSVTGVVIYWMLYHL